VFHIFDFAPGKTFVQKKSPRLLLREAAQRASHSKSQRGEIGFNTLPQPGLLPKEKENRPLFI
jgi:hypothetical protein